MKLHATWRIHGTQAAACVPQVQCDPWLGGPLDVPMSPVDLNFRILGRGIGPKGCAPRFPPDSRSQNLKILDLVPKSCLLTSKMVRTRFRVHVPGPSGPWIQAFSVGIHPPSANPSAEMVPIFWVHVPGPSRPYMQVFFPRLPSASGESLSRNVPRCVVHASSIPVACIPFLGAWGPSPQVGLGTLASKNMLIVARRNCPELPKRCPLSVLL